MTMLCHTRKSLERTSRKNPRFKRNYRPGRCASCGTWIPAKEGCVDVTPRGKAAVYC